MVNQVLGESPFVYLSGIESTYMRDADIDVLQTTRHDLQYDTDIELASKLGLRHLRYSAPWHRIERERGVFDWDWMDRAVEALQRHGVEPIVDLLHHTSFPKWLDGGFANRDFPAAFTRFAAAFAERYPSLRWYTIFNELYVTCLICGEAGIWYPYYKDGARSFIPMLVNGCRAMCMATHAVRERVPHARFLHVDTCEYHHALDDGVREEVDLRNERRFLAHDMVTGRVDEKHPLWNYLVESGFPTNLVDWFKNHKEPIDLLGLDYYAHSEIGVSSRGSRPLKVRGFSAVAKDYQDRYPSHPCLLGETNVRGTVYDRLSWMKHMLEQCDLCEQEGHPLKGFCWYPLIDTCDWDSLLRNPRCHVDPQGIFWLNNSRYVRHESILSEWFGRIIRHEATWRDIPAYRFTEDCKGWVKNHLRLMEHWEWRDADA